MIRRFALVLLFLSIALIAAGGDIAIFENLGFSRNGEVFLFGQYGVEAESGAAFAELYAVDVPSNNFVPGGVFNTASSAERTPLSLGQDGRGALYGLVRQAGDLIRTHDVDHLNNGRPVYILVDGDLPRERVAFRDFNTNTRYEILLRQDRRGTESDTEASFHIQLNLTFQDDTTRSLTIGRPSYYRSGITRYRITQVLLNPSEDSVVIVVEKQLVDGSIRYMVETAALR